MTGEVLQTLWFFVPAYLANMAPVVAQGHFDWLDRPLVCCAVRKPEPAFAIAWTAATWLADRAFGKPTLWQQWTVRTLVYRSRQCGRW